MKATWICSLFTAFLFSWNGFADCGESHGPSLPPSAPSESPASGPSTPPSTSPSGPAGGEPTSVKDQMGLTLNPGSGGGGSSVTDPNLVGVGLPKVTNFGLIYGNDIAAKYLQLWEQMLQLNESKKEAATNEKVRIASWEKNSGLDHAKQQLEKSYDRLSDAQKKETKANDKYDKVISDYADWDREKFITETRQKNAEVGSKEWYDMIEKNMQLDKQKPALDSARQEAWNQVQDARKETQQFKEEVRANINRMDTAMEKYHSMEANYQAVQNAPIPAPSR